ncbi:MAG TPA: S8 family serine peptidase [Acetobacteraceae bacterium]|nr:S8 family serine peptidase [Acetobacteraceae bacterium]
MATDYQFRLYATLKYTQDLFTRYSTAVSQRDLQLLTEYTHMLLDGKPHVSQELLKEIRVVSAPSLDWQPTIVGATPPPDIPPDELVIAYGFDRAYIAEQFINFVITNRDAPLDVHANAFLDVGTDPGGSTADHWCPGPANRAIFRHRASARQTVNADALTQLTGQAVNVVIIDQGLDKDAIPAPNWGGGLGPNIGKAERTSHGMMMVRSILDLAPNAVLYDVPLIPPRITNIPAFLSAAEVIFHNLIKMIEQYRLQAAWSGPWILVNAWAIYDRSTDLPPFGSYTENKAFGGHPFIKRVTRAVQHHHLDVIFAAGNCGEFCPSQRCGGLDRGPGHSIWGANGHPLVITAGAVRTDEIWLGYSSQGPGPAALATRKPDFCAPSQFCETNDAAVLNSGSSAACAMTAGVVAALRSNPAWNQFTVTPAAMRAALIASARKTLGPGWNERLGFGILDARSAIGQLP